MEISDYAALRFDGRTVASAAAESPASSRLVVRQRATYASISCGSSIDERIMAFSRRITARKVSEINTMKTVAVKMMKTGVMARYCDMTVSIPLGAVPNACALSV